MFAMSMDELKAAIGKILARKKGRKKTVVVTMDHEVGWRLQKLGNLWGIPQGLIVEALIAETVSQFRLPYDQFGRESIWNTSTTEGAMRKEESGGESVGETLPMGEGLTSSEIEKGPLGTGAEEGGKGSPAPAQPAVGGKGRPAQARGKRPGHAA